MLTSENNVLALGVSGYFLFSDDFMKTWIIDTLSTIEYITQYPYLGENFISASTDKKGNVCAIAYHSTITWSDDFGKTFNIKNWYDDLYSVFRNYAATKNIFFLNHDEILVSTGGARVYKSYDGGVSWKYVFPILHNVDRFSDSLKLIWGPVNSWVALLSQGYFFDADNGFIMGEKDAWPENELTIYTTDGGDTWERNDMVYGPDFIRYPDGHFLSTVSDYKYLSYDNAKSWKKIKEFNLDGESCVGITRIDNNAFSLVWQNTDDPEGGRMTIYRVYKSEDGGETFLSVFCDSNRNRRWFDISSDSKNDLYLTGSGHMILNSSDLGESWNEIPVPLRTVKDILFISDSNWLICGRDDSLAISTDSGYSWEVKDLDFWKFFDDLNCSLEQAKIHPDGSIYIVGYGRIVRGIKKVNTNIIESNTLPHKSNCDITVFPNPARKNVNIRIFPKTTDLKGRIYLTLYDIYGNRIGNKKTINLSDFDKKVLNQNFYLEELAAGVYFVKVIYGKQITVRKIIKK